MIRVCRLQFAVAPRISNTQRVRSAPRCYVGHVRDATPPASRLLPELIVSSSVHAMCASHTLHPPVPVSIPRSSRVSPIGKVSGKTPPESRATCADVNVSVVLQIVVLEIYRAETPWLRAIFFRL